MIGSVRGISRGLPTQRAGRALNMSMEYEAFFRAIMEFSQNQANLDSILASLDETQADAYSQ